MTEQATEHLALGKHTCAACGAEGEWNPSRQALVCPFCGTVSPVDVDRESGELREIDLVRALRELPDEERGWLAARRSVRCRSCDAVSVLDPGRVGQNCEFCGSTELVDYQELRAPIRPCGVVPFRIDKTGAQTAARGWLATRWLAPRRLKREAVERLHGVYLPYWTFDAQAFCRWSADSGTYYYTTETVRDSRGRTRTQQVRHVRWRPMRGLVEHFFDDQPVPGSRGVDGRLLAGLEPFPKDQLVPYETSFLAGFVVEHYQVVLVDACRQARESMVGQLRELCAREVPGDTYRNLEIEPEFTGQTFKHILLPAWLASYRFGSRTYQLLVNGATGTVAGRYPWSPWKVALLVLAAGAAVAAAAWFASMR